MILSNNILPDVMRAKLNEKEFRTRRLPLKFQKVRTLGTIETRTLWNFQLPCVVMLPLNEERNDLFSNI